jgi:thioesterase domain-containing protein
MHLYRLAGHAGTRRPFLALRRSSDARSTDTLSQIAARNVAAMVAYQPTGPYYLGGYSFGATVAYEMACQLAERGGEIGLLAIIDQRRPGWRLTPYNALPALYRILVAFPQRLGDEVTQTPRGRRLRHLLLLWIRWARMALGYRWRAGMLDLNAKKAEQIDTYEANIRALHNYQPTKLRASLVLFRAEIQPQTLSSLAMDFKLGWSELAEGGVQVRVVPGDHSTMITEPLVSHLAKSLSDELDVPQGLPPQLAPRKLLSNPPRHP